MSNRRGWPARTTSRSLTRRRLARCAKKWFRSCVAGMGTPKRNLVVKLLCGEVALKRTIGSSRVRLIPSSSALRMAWIRSQMLRARQVPRRVLQSRKRVDLGEGISRLTKWSRPKAQRSWSWRTRSIVSASRCWKRARCRSIQKSWSRLSSSQSEWSCQMRRLGRARTIHCSLRRRATLFLIWTIQTSLVVTSD